MKTKHRKAMLRNMATEFFRHEKIRTTDVKAKELKRVADKIVTLAKNGAKEDAAVDGLSFKRRIFSYINDKEVARKIFTEIAERYRQRPGGYSRITSLGYRRGDQTPVSQIELVTEDCEPVPSKKKTRKSNLPAPPNREVPKESSAEDSAPAEKEQPRKEPKVEASAKEDSPDKAGEKDTKPEAAEPKRDGEEG